MKDAGLDQMVIQWTADSKSQTTIYPSALEGYAQNTTHDVVEEALKTADAAGAQVYIGLQINDDWWTRYISDGPWLRNEAKIAHALASELWKRYGQHASFAGWYLPFEVDNVETGTADWDNLVAFYRSTGNHLHRLAAGKPVAISPFFNSKLGLSPSQWQTMWEYVLKRSPIDVIAVQDGIGASHANRDELPTWFGAVKAAIEKSRPEAKLWVDTETFDRDLQPMAIRSIVNDMCAVQSYVSGYLSFSFNHFLSPQQVNPLYYRTYMQFLETGKVEKVSPSKPAELGAAALDAATIRLTWTASTDNVGVAGYRIRRNDQLVTTTHDASSAYVDSGLDSEMTYRYQIKAFDAAGNESDVSDAATATTPQPHLYPVNIALGRPYAATMAANASYPDTSGVELTDGALDSTNYADPSWQGRATNKPYSFTIDLGEVQVIREVRSHWLQDKPSAVFLPKQISWSISDDGVNFGFAGTVTKPAPGDENLSRWYTLTDLAGFHGRYVRMQVTPGWSAGWTFVDEIEVRR